MMMNNEEMGEGSRHENCVMLKMKQKVTTLPPRSRRLFIY
jgi:hypothetical protein